MSTFSVLYWQEIPSVIRAGDEKRQLPDWFQQEIDRVAMEQGLLGSDEYLERWEWREERFDGDLDAFQAALVERYPGSQPSR